MKNSRKITAAIMALAMTAQAAPLSGFSAIVHAEDALIADAVDNEEIGNWTEEFAPDNEVSYGDASIMTVSGDTATFAPTSIYFRPMGNSELSWEAGRPAGKCWVGVKITSVAKDFTNIYYNSQSVQDGELESGEKFVYLWTGFDVNEVLTALAENNGIIKKTFDFRGEKSDVSDFSQMPFTVEINVNNITMHGVAESPDKKDDTEILKTVDGKLVSCKVDNLATLKKAIAASESSESADKTTIELTGDIKLTNSDLVLEIANKNIIIDGNDKNIVGVNDYNGGEMHAIKFTGAGDVTLRNVTLTQFAGVNSQYNTYPILTSVAYTGTLTLDNVNINEFSRTALNLCGGNVAVKKCTITGGTAAKNNKGEYFQSGIEVYQAKVTVADTTIRGIGSDMHVGDTADFWTPACIQLGNPTANEGNGEITVLSGDFSVTNKIGRALIVVANTPGEAELNINGGKFLGGILFEKPITSDANETSVTYGDRAYSVNINGGVFSDDSVIEEDTTGTTEITLDSSQEDKSEDSETPVAKETIAKFVSEGKSVFALNDATYKFGVAENSTVSISAEVDGEDYDESIDYDGKTTVTLKATGLKDHVDANNITNDSSDDYNIDYTYKWLMKTAASDSNSEFVDIDDATALTYNVGPAPAASATYKFTATSGSAKLSATTTKEIEIAKLANGFDEGEKPILVTNQAYRGVPIQLIKSAGIPKSLNESDVMYLITTSSDAPAPFEEVPPTIEDNAGDDGDNTNTEGGADQSANGTSLGAADQIVNGTSSVAAEPEDYLDKWLSYDEITKFKANSTGTYYVWYQIKESENYEGVKPTLLDTIKLSQYLYAQTWSLTLKDYDYDGTAHTPTIDGTTHGKLTYVYTNTDTNKVLTAAPSAIGNYKVELTADGGDEYSSRTQEVSYSIKAPEITSADGTADVTVYKENNVAPKTEGQTFAGWYTDETCTTPYTGKTGKAYAKFIDAKVLTVKAQISSGATADSASTSIRFLTSLDSLKYDNIGFRIKFNGKVVDQKMTKVYTAIKANGGKVKPGVFSDESHYMASYTLNNIPKKYYGETFTVTPYYTTQDGTIVEGETNTFAISNMIH